MPGTLPDMCVDKGEANLISAKYARLMRNPIHADKCIHTQKDGMSLCDS